MPFKSENQRRFLWAKHPEIAKRWAAEEKGNSVPRKKRTSGARAIQESKARQAAYNARVAKLEASRKATAKRLSGQTATTQAQLGARKTPAKPKPGGLSGLVGTILEGRGKLESALKPKRKKKD